MELHPWNRLRQPALAAVAFLLVPVTTSPAVAQTDRIDSAAIGGLEWRPIGPAIMGGRVADLAVVESNPAIFYVGTATGGLWKTTNHGTTWEPLFDDQPTASIGDVTLAPSNPNIVWVGTGEPQNRQSSPWGNGVYKSMDGGNTWTHMGLEETRHIARIVIHPTDPDVVYVAAVGHLWGSNPERGVFKSTDGGKTWAKSLYVDEHTGAIDLVMDPGDPETLFAAMYQRRRTGFGFNGGGPGSGIYRTNDGGASWQELTNGLPEGHMGRIGLDIYLRDGNLVYAVVEAAPNRGRGVYRSTDRGETWEQLSETNRRPMYFSQIRIDPNDPERIYLGAVRLHVSDDGGKNFRDDGARRVHSDHHALWIDPHNSNHLILGSDGGVSVSFDRSRNWRMYDNLALGQFYEIGVDMRDPYYVCGGLQDNGSWCGPSATHSRSGILNGDWYNINGGDGFYTKIDPNDPTIIFAESQNGNIARVDITTGERTQIRPLPRPSDEESATEEEEEERTYRWNWNSPILMSSHDPATVYVGANVLLKSTDRGFTWQETSPDLTKALDRSELEIMGRPLADSLLSRNDGIRTYGNITTIGESPLNSDVLYVGTDDGNLQITRDAGATWNTLTSRIRGLPERTYVSRVIASRQNEGTVYATFDGHRNDDYQPYVYRSDDYGNKWDRIVDGLPDWSVNVIREHPRNPNLLFVGNEIGVYFSIDRGESWMRLKNNLPTVPVDDIVIHPRENDLVIGTHGRSVWILPDITPLEQLSRELLASAVHLFPVRPATIFNVYSPQRWAPGAYSAPNPPAGASIRYYLKDDLPAQVAIASDDNAEGSVGPRRRRSRRHNTNSGDEEPTVKLTIIDANGETIRELEGPGEAGTHQVVWDLRYPPPFVAEEGQQQRSRFFRRTPRGPRVLPGTYAVRLEALGQALTTDVVLEGDPRIQISRADLEARQQALMTLYTLAKPVYDAGRTVRRLGEQISEIRTLLADNEDAPQELRQEVRTLGGEIREIGGKLNPGRGGTFRLFSGIDGATSAPTRDQEWQLGRTWEEATKLIEQLNVIISDRMPALNRQLDEHGIRPSPGKVIELPNRP